MKIIRFIAKWFVGICVISALSIMLKQVDPDSDSWWFNLTSFSWAIYCTMDYSIIRKAK